MTRINRAKTKTPIPELKPEVRSTNFDEVALGYTVEMAINEALRCMRCSNKPCEGGCPVGVPIREFVGCVADGNLAGAYAHLKNANALPAICGRVCPQETQCEGVCTRGHKSEPVSIGRLERFVADWAYEHPAEANAAFEANADALKTQARRGTVPETSVPTINPLVSLKGKKVAVVGSGPSSLTCAGELAKHGASVTIYEALHDVGGVLTYGIPEFRLPKKLVRREVKAITKLGVTIEPNAVVGKLYEVNELLDEMGYDAVFIGAGAGLPRYLGIEGEGYNGVMMANELLTRVNLMKAYLFPVYDTPVYVGQRCVVVGGGNVAMDAARTAKRLGADVCVVYRRSRNEMPAREEEIHHAEEEGIHFKLLTNPVRILGNDAGWITGVECIEMELGEPDSSGRRRPIEKPGSNFVMDIDALIVAAGSKTNPLIAQTTPGLKTNQFNHIVIDEHTGATSVPGVFAGGDVTSGAATVIMAMGAGKRAAWGIANYLTNTE